MSDCLTAKPKQQKDEIATEHNMQLTESLNEMRKMGVNCDCSILVKKSGATNLSLRMHYNIASAASEYCRSNWSHSDGKWTIELDLEYWLDEKKIVEEALEQCIEFMYIGKADIRDDTVEYITKLSHILQLKPLEDKGLEAMQRNLTTCQNCRTLLIAARYCNREEYKTEAIKKWISVNLMNISSTEECSPENMWKSAANLLRNSALFQQEVNILDVLKVIEIEKVDCKFMLEVVMTNNKVTGDSAAAEYTFQIVCKKIKEKSTNLTTENYYMMKDLLQKHEDKGSGLKKILKNFIIRHFDALVEQNRFLDTKHKELTSIFPKLCCSEEKKFDSIVKWVSHEPQRAESFPELFKMIKLENLSDEAFRKIRMNPLMEKYTALMLPVFDAMMNKRQTTEHRRTHEWVQNLPSRPGSNYASAQSNKSHERPESSKKSSHKISNFSTASLREDMASSVAHSDSEADNDEGYGTLQSEI